MGPTVAYILCHRKPEHALLSDFLNYGFNHIMLQKEEESKTQITILTYTVLYL